MNKLHNKEGPDHDVGYHVFRLSRDGTIKIACGGTHRMTRDGTKRMTRDGTERMTRDGTKRMARDGTLKIPGECPELLVRDKPGNIPGDGIERQAMDKIEELTRDGTLRMARDGIRRLARDGTIRKPRDGTRRRPIDVSTLYLESYWIHCHQQLIIKPPGKGIFNRAKYFRRRNEIGGKPPLGRGEAELCPDVIGVKNDKFSKFAVLGFENMIMNTTY